MSYRMLVVDDSVFIRRVISDVCNKIGIDVVGEAVDVEDAVEQFIKLRPDVVTMDIHMPSRDGLQTGIHATKAIKDINPDVKVIMVTALGHRKSVIQAIKAGANDYIVKPLEEDNLVRVIKKVLDLNDDKK